MNNHVVIDAIRQTFRCDHCRHEAPLPMPCSITVMTQECQNFEATHEGCPRPTEPLKPMRVRTGPNGAALVRDHEGLWWEWQPTPKRGTYVVTTVTRALAIQQFQRLVEQFRTSSDYDDQAAVRYAQLAVAEEGLKP